MTSSQFSDINLSQLLEHKSIEIDFQPIVSIRRGSIVGIEALSRGLTGTGRIPPAKLFNLAAAESLTLELDHLCRTTALETFLPLHVDDPNLILFVNFHTSTIEQDGLEVARLNELTQRLNLDPRNVAIEVVEAEFKNAKHLQAAVEHYKNSGFLVVLDDIGVGHSNLERITFIKPDMIKADRSLVHNIHNDYYKQEILKALVNLSEKIGGWIIVEGVEKQEEAICSLSLGADFLQGFYFAQPHKIVSIDQAKYDLKRVQDAAVQFKKYTLNKARATQLQQEKHERISAEIIAQLQTVSSENFEQQLMQTVSDYAEIESACVLNTAGIQITETVQNPQGEEKQKTIIFQPPAKGTNHSFKEYYYLLIETSMTAFTTNPYVPLPSGNLCVTASTLFEANHETFMLCLHIVVDRSL